MFNETYFLDFTFVSLFKNHNNNQLLNGFTQRLNLPLILHSFYFKYIIIIKSWWSNVAVIITKNEKNTKDNEVLNEHLNY